MEKRGWKYYIIGLLTIAFVGLLSFKKFNFNNDHKIGQRIDSLNGVFVYYNGKVSNVTGRNTTVDGYNLGLKYQCVEFVKRYYYEHLKHKMPDSYGDAKTFFDKSLKDGSKNSARALTQYTNSSRSKPKVDDLLIFDETTYNQYGHVAIISKVSPNKIEIIQQNPPETHGNSKETILLNRKDGKWEIENKQILGWLRKE